MTRAILLFGREQLRLLVFAGSNVMKTIYLMMGLVTLTQLSGCARPIMESNYQKTQPLLTQMLCPMCDVPSLNPVVAKAPTLPQPVESQTISTVDNPEPISEITAATDIQPAPVEVVPQPVNLPPSAPSKPRVITLDLNAPDLGVSSQSAPTPEPVPPQSKVDNFEKPIKKTSSSQIQLTEADIHNAQDVHELTVRLMHLNQ
jgi:hypothetical protein